MIHGHPDLLLLIPLLDDARGAAYSDALGRDVVGDGGVAADDAAVADGDAGQDGAEFADPDVILDDDGLAGRQGTLGWRHVGAVGLGAAVDAMVVVGDVDLTAHEDVVANLDTVDAADVDVLAEAHVVADDEVRRKVLFMPGFAVRVDGLHPEPPARREMLADLHVFYAADVGVVVDVDIPPAKRATRKEHVPDALPVEGQRIEHALLLQAFLEQDTAVRPFPLLHKNLPFNAEFIS